MEETSLTDFLGAEEVDAEDDGTEEVDAEDDGMEEAEAEDDGMEEAEAGADGADSEVGDGPTAAVDDPAGTSAVDVDGVEPAEATAAWSSAGDTCEGCGDPADWRWRDGDAMVCRACKSW